MKKWIVLGFLTSVLVGAAGMGAYVVLATADATAPESTAEHTGAIAANDLTEVERGDVERRMVVEATVVAEPGVPVRARRGGTVTRVWLADGSDIERGAPIVTLAAPAAGATEGGPAASGETVVRAPASGTVTDLGDLAVGDPVEAGTIAQITREEFRAVAAIDPNDAYQFHGEPGEILLKIDRGPAARPCAFLSLGPASSGSGDADGGAGTGADGLELACRVPDTLRVFPGVRGTLSIVTGEADNVLVVPLTAVRGTVDRGEAVVVDDTGSTEVREVTLGVSDGQRVEVVSGLSVGETIMDPIPLSEEFDAPSAPLSQDEDGPLPDGHGFAE